MKVLLDVPAGWTAATSGTWALLTSPDNQARVEVTPLLAHAGLDIRGVMERAIEAPRTARYVQLLEDVQTRDGWPMTLATLSVMTGEIAGEWRLAASYRMLAWGAVACARVKTRVAYDALRPVLLELLGSARPHLWGDEPACVAELFTGEPA